MSKLLFEPAVAAATEVEISVARYVQRQSDSPCSSAASADGPSDDPRATHVVVGSGCIALGLDGGSEGLAHS